MTLTQNTIMKSFLATLLAVPLLIGVNAQAAVPSFDTTGTYQINMEYLGGDNFHDMVLTQDNLGNVTGGGGSPAGANVYTWEITEGTVDGNIIDITANYTATADAVTPLTVLQMTGTIAADGTIAGVWSDNYQAGTRTGTFTTVEGAAQRYGALAAEDFGVVSYDTGVTGDLHGYTAGFGLTNATFEGATSVVVKLYAGDTLLQTNTATDQFAAIVTGTQMSSPFDVSGDFDYVADGYWENVREAEFGQSVPATKVVATVTLENGKVVTATNMVLVGDPTTIYPDVVPPVEPPVVTGPTDKDQCKDGGWKTFTTPAFKNQGQCVSSVASTR